MKLIFLILAIITPLGVWSGYNVGSALSFHPTVDAIIENVEVRPSGAVTYALNFECGGETLATFDVDSDKVISAKLTIDEVDKRAASIAKNRKVYQRIYDSVFGFATGGGAIKYGKPVLRILKAKENSKYTIPAIIGGLSGFYLGYELAIRHRLDCSDVAVIDLAQDDGIWRDIKSTIASHYLLQEFGFFSSAKDDPKIAADYTDVRRAIAEDKVNSATFAKLQAISAYVRPKQSVVGWFSLEMILAVYFPVVCLLLGAVGSAVMLSEYLAKAARVRRSRKQTSA